MMRACSIITNAVLAAHVLLSWCHPSLGSELTARGASRVDQIPIPASYFETKENGNEETNFDRRRRLATFIERDPVPGQTLTSGDYIFTADIGGRWIRRVYFRIIYPSGREEDYEADRVSVFRSEFEIQFSGFFEGEWSWQIWVQEATSWFSLNTQWDSSSIETFVVDFGTIDDGGDSDQGNDGNGDEDDQGNDEGGDESDQDGQIEVVAGLQPSCLTVQPNSFEICLGLAGEDSGVKYDWMDDFGVAAKRWQKAIVGDLSDLATSSISSFTLRQLNTCSDLPSTLDDIYICGESFDGDGFGGVLAAAAPTLVRRDTLLPLFGFMQFDISDISQLRSRGQFQGVVEHEMGHVLGIGTLWQMKDLYDGSSGRYATSSRATEEWRALGCTGALPVERDFGPGTAGAHWDETCVRDELMTGIRSGQTNPMSRLTIAAMDDLGYEVDYSAADPFSKDDLGFCGSFCPGTRHLRALTTNHRRQLSKEGLDRVWSFGVDTLQRRKVTSRVALPDHVMYVGDKFLDVLYMENDEIYGFRVSGEEGHELL